RVLLIPRTSAGVDWLIGRVPEHVGVYNARGVYDAPLAEWVVGAILAMRRGLVPARDAAARRAAAVLWVRQGLVEAREAQAGPAWEGIEPPELLERRVVILGIGSIGTAIGE